MQVGKMQACFGCVSRMHAAHANIQGRCNHDTAAVLRTVAKLQAKAGLLLVAAAAKGAQAVVPVPRLLVSCDLDPFLRQLVRKRDPAPLVLLGLQLLFRGVVASSANGCSARAGGRGRPNQGQWRRCRPSDSRKGATPAMARSSGWAVWGPQRRSRAPGSGCCTSPQLSLASAVQGRGRSCSTAAALRSIAARCSAGTPLMASSSQGGRAARKPAKQCHLIGPSQFASLLPRGAVA